MSSERYVLLGLAPARAALGADEAAEAWTEGQTMTLEQAVVDALEEARPREGAGPATPPAPLLVAQASPRPADQTPAGQAA